MKNFSIAVLNASINAKAQNTNINLYQWVKYCYDNKSTSFKEYYANFCLTLINIV